ncbi:MAG: hypothetical protein IKC65_03865 [Lentisphaeria bacterium]|nr:hypothetical protein [Lentisphaeria bacterium]
MKKTILLYAAVLAAGSLWSANDLSDLRGLSLTNAKIPIYNRGGRPQMMIFVNKAERRGRVLSGTETVLEFIRPSASVDDIGDAWKTRAYPLEAPFRQVFDFWLPRSKYSEAVVTTVKADIDPQTHKASGSAPIYFRSPLLDLNGVGFEADFDRRQIRINSEIEVLLRMSSSDPRKLKSVQNKRYDYLTASGDSLLIELENKRILLIGSVIIKEKQSTITCDRLTIELGGEKKTVQPKNKKQLINAQSELDGLSRLLADGNITVSGSAGASGRIYADHMVYDLKNSRITLTSDTPEQQLSRQELLRNAAKYSRMAPEDIVGYVILDDKEIRSYGRSVVVNLKNAGSKTPSPGLVGSSVSMTGGNKTGALQTILYPEGIVLTGKSGRDKNTQPFFLHADQGEYLPGHNVIHLKENILAREGSTRLTCQKAVLKLKKQAGKNKKETGLDINSIHCREQVSLFHQGEGTQSGTLFADKADFFPHDNRILFYENVKAKHDKSTLDCRQLELLLASRKAAVPARTKSGTALTDSAAAAKSLKQVIASGNVRMTDPHAILNCGELVMDFRELKAGEKSAPGMLQAGGARLTRISGNNGVKVISRNNTAARKLFGTAESKGIKTLTAMRSMTCLLTNKTTLDGHVHIFDELTSLKCSTMHLYGKKSQPQKAAAKPKNAADDIDADPYAILNTENFAPSRIALTGDLELDKVECIKNVVLSRKVPNGELRAGGDRADYKVSSRQVIITGKAPNRPWAEMDDRRQESDRLIYHLAEERFESSGNTKTTLKKRPGNNGAKK